MTALTLVLNHPDAEHGWRHWAEAENQIDFRRDFQAAERCTAAFAAFELKTFLEKADPQLQISVGSARPTAGAFIDLQISDRNTGGGFKLIPDGPGLIISGHGRNGLLNGAYELLRRQGWRWLEPGPYGESAPITPALNWPQYPEEVIPSFRYRMIDQYRESDDSVEYLRWQARNRINVVFRKAATGKFADKLGMLSRKGGHLLQQLMDPNRIMPGGRTIWEEHPEWYGLPSDGKRQKATATRTQLCISQPSLPKYLAARILELLTTEMADVDILDVWGFDTWGKNCHCPACNHTGNGADQNLFLLSQIREHLDRHLKRRVWLNTLAYEGSVTLEAPTRPVPPNLIAAGDMVIFFPIRRCYRHPLNDQDCPLNQSYHRAVEDWQHNGSGLSLWAGEYYNVSKFEDLPLVFSRLIPSEMRYYHAHGCNGITYMHSISTNWGVRSLTQLQHTQFAWQRNTDETAFLQEYFERKYAKHASHLRSVYHRIEDGLADISSWRNYQVGALDVLSAWDGTRPEKEFTLPHFPTAASVSAALRHGISQLESALAELRLVLRREQETNWQALPRLQDIPPVLTPLELEKIRYYDKYEYRLGEDCRMLIYGLDTMLLLLALVEYHDARFQGHSGNREWEQIELIAAKMSDYYVPISFENPTPGVICRDALSRTQLRPLLTRYRGARLQPKSGETE